MSRVGWLACMLILGWFLAWPASAQITITGFSDRLDLASKGPDAIATQPVLYLERDALVGNARGGAVDARGAYFVIVGEDKSASVWSVASGELVSILRAPLGDGPIGDLSSAAMTADGATVAVGWRSHRTSSILFFDARTGRMKGRINGLADVVTDLRFSPDGRMIGAVGISGVLQVFAYPTGAPIGRGSGAAESYSVDFSPDGKRVLTTNLDGQLRLYAVERGALRLIGAVETRTATGQPMNARFSPDGQLVAVSMHRGAAVRILDASNLALLWSLDTPLLGSNMPELSWTPDGSALYSFYIKSMTESRVRRWTRPQGSAMAPWAATDIAVAENGIVSGVGAIPGGLVFMTTGPAWGVITPSGGISWKHVAARGRFARYAIDTSKQPPLLLSSDGRKVGFTFDGHKDPAAFGLAEKAYLGKSPDLKPARKSAPGIKIKLTGAFGLASSSAVAQLNGFPLPLDNKELATSYAISPDGNTFALGTVTGVRMFTKDGRQLWRQAVKVYAVNISGDGRWVVIDCRDGALRWYRASDGALALTLYPHPDRKRWVMWTPSGYYDASEGGEELIGWLVNSGPNAAAQFHPASQFSQAMWRPDLLSRVLSAGDEDKALQQANQVSFRKDAKITPQAIAAQLPPVLELLEYPTTFSTGSIKVRYRVTTSKTLPIIGAPGVRVNGVWRPGARAAVQVAADGSRELVIDGLKPADSEVAIDIKNAAGASTPQTFKVTWIAKGGAKGLVAGAAVRKPKLYVLAIGVSDYDQSELKLNYAQSDARRFAATMSKQQGKQYSQVIVKVLQPTETDRTSIAAALTWFESQPAADDVGIIYLAGHGVSTESEYFFAPRGFRMDDPGRTGINYLLIRDAISNFARKGNRGVLIMDTCYAGKGLSQQLAASNGGRLVNELKRGQAGVYVVTSSQADERSLEAAEWGGGAFTTDLLAGLDGGADPYKAGSVTYPSLGVFLTQQVPKRTSNRQTPMYVMPPGVVETFVLTVQ